MNTPLYPPEVKDFVDQAIAAGEYRNEGEVLVDAVRALGEIKRQHQSLRDDVQAGFAELDAKQGEPWDASEIKQELRQQIEADGPTT